MKGLSRRPLGHVLVTSGMVTQTQIEEALDVQKRTHKKLGEVLVELGIISEEQITEARALQLDVAYANLQEQQVDPGVASLIGESIARTYKLIPVGLIGDQLTIAMVNPLDVEAIDLVQFETKYRIEPALATEWRIVEAINRLYGQSTDEDLQSLVEKTASDAADGVVDPTHDLSDGIDEMKRQSHRAPIVRMVNMILTHAVRRRASDIHIEPRRSNTEVRYRIDGELSLDRSVPRPAHAALTSRIKIMADMDISERRLPQDGRIAVKIDGRTVDMRVSTSPTICGERTVLRILDRAQSLIPLESLGFGGKDLDTFRRMISLPHGIILVTGPTGSGKTTTLYAALNAVKAENINIMTVEDPVEYELDGVNQTNVHHRIGLTFAAQLRSILRQDPDVVLVGEVRDGETADVAFRAALTGHLVLSTLHCNDAPGAIARLLDMDVEPFLVSSAINGVLAQRLVRQLCPDCREPYEADDNARMVLDLMPNARPMLYRAVGCGNCDGTGYRGRTAVREMMLMDDRIRALALSRAPVCEIYRAAMDSGMVTMREDATSKVLAGITTVQEVQRKVFIALESSPVCEVELSPTDLLIPRTGT